MDTDIEECRGEEKKKLVLPTGGGEATNPEKTEALYASVRSWVTEEEDGITLPSYKGVDEYREPVDPK